MGLVAMRQLVGDSHFSDVVVTICVVLTVLLVEVNERWQP